MSANEVDAALAAPAAEVGPRLLALGEDQWFDRKSAQIAAKDLGPPLIAFANAEGGVIVIGLSSGKVQGFKEREPKLNEIRQASIDFTVPPVRAVLGRVDCINYHGERDFLIVIRVDPGERVHELRNGDCYLRIGDESRRLNYHQRQELEFDKGQSQYDGFPCQGISLDDLDPELVEDFRNSTGARNDAESVFKARSLLTRSGDVTNAAYLLFGVHPQDQFPQAYVRVIRFLSSQRGTGARLGLEEGADVRLDGPIPHCIDEASTAIDEMLPRRRHLVESGRFEARPIVPRDAWLEGLVNAVIHRSYSLAGDHIRVEIYPDRVEIESPGRFPGLANPSKPLEISRFARNPRIARVCADLRIGQELGEGIKRIFEEMRRVGLTDPVYKQTGGSVRLVLAATPRLDNRLAARLPRGSQRVLDVLRVAGPLSTGDIAEEMGLSRPATLVRLRALEDARLIRWSGKSRKDPRAVWILNED
jgi:ATP-dependent DNA helicase RecG